MDHVIEYLEAAVRTRPEAVAVADAEREFTFAALGSMAWGLAALLREKGLSGRAVGLWTDADLNALQETDRRFTPAMDERQRERLIHSWRRAVERSKGWAEEED